MADQVTVDNGTLTDYSVSTDDAGASGHVQRVKLTLSADGSASHIPADADGLLVNLGANNDVVVSDGGGSVTVDNTALAVVGGGAEATALRVTLANDSTGVVSVDDNGSTISVDDGAGSLTVDGSVSLAAAIPAGANNIGDVDVLTVPADPFGANADAAATAGSTGSIQAKLRLVTSQLDAIKTAVETLDNTVGGSELQVDIVSAPTLTVNSHAVTNAGTFAVQDSEKIADDGGFTVGTTKVQPIGFLADETSTDSVDEGDLGAARMTLDRKLRVTPTPHTTGGVDVFRTLDADETEEDVKTAAGQVYGWYIYNDGAAEVYVKLYNATAANVTVGSTTPRMTIPVPAGSAANVDFNHGIQFDTAICIAATTGVADADTTAPAANQVVANILYK